MLLTAAAPVLVATALAAHLFNAGPRDAVPLADDEVAYWNQIAAFSRAGWHGGYHTVNEQPSRARFSRFGPHGPAFPIAYGIPGRLFGWRPYSAALISMALVTLAAAWWAWRTRCGWWGALALSTFWPLVVMLPTTMQEPLHFAIALAIASAVGPRLATKTGRGAGAIVACLACGLLRPTWAFTAVPVAWAATRGRAPRTQVTAIAAAAAGAVAISMVFGWLAAPYPGAMFSVREATPALLLRQMAERAALNARAFVVPDEADPLEVLVRGEMAAMLVAAALVTWRTPAERTGPAMFVLMLLGLTMAAVITGGSVERWRDFRVVAPALLLALAAWLPAHRRVPRAFVAAHVLLLPLAIASFQRLHAPRFAPQVKTEHFARSIATALSFRPDTDGWQNTILMHVDAVDGALVALPHGVAVSVTFAWEDIALPPKSRYLLLRPRDLADLSGRASLRRLAATPIGGIYENAAAIR